MVKHPGHEVLSLEETKWLIKAKMEQGERGIKEMNPKRSVGGLERWEKS